MAKTSIDIATILYHHLKFSVLMTDSNKPNGELCLYQRPVNSELEDVVINTLALDREQFQNGILNVNIYVPNLDIRGDLTQPNTQRIAHLYQLAEQSLGDVWSYDGTYNFRIEQDKLFQDENNQHYINLRIEFISINT